VKLSRKFGLYSGQQKRECGFLVTSGTFLILLLLLNVNSDP
jgi:hypothetical protein